MEKNVKYDMKIYYKRQIKINAGTKKINLFF